MNTLTPNDESHFTAIESDLDEAIQRLGPDDRDVILLRFFERQNLRAVGDALGVSENVAQKRVARALSELRIMLGARGTAISVASLGTILGRQSRHSGSNRFGRDPGRRSKLREQRALRSISSAGAVAVGKFKSALIKERFCCLF